MSTYHFTAQLTCIAAFKVIWPILRIASGRFKRAFGNELPFAVDVGVTATRLCRLDLIEECEVQHQDKTEYNLYRCKVAHVLHE